MKTHDRLRIVFAPACQNWRVFSYFMHVHENCYIKRAGVAGIRERALPYVCLFIKIIVLFSVGTLVPAGRLARLKFIVQFRVAKDTDFSFASLSGDRYAKEKSVSFAVFSEESKRYVKLHSALVLRGVICN